MLEFLLINHPLDCPVCDQSGECDLQNFYMEIGRYDSRFLENKLKKKKAFPIGPHVMLDQERCILCSRCIRFCEEVSKTHELGIFQRGNHSIVDLHPGKKLDNPYSGNVIDICPVGALTETEFRFQCRVWYLQDAGLGLQQMLARVQHPDSLQHGPSPPLQGPEDRPPQAPFQPARQPVVDVRRRTFWLRFHQHEPHRVPLPAESREPRTVRLGRDHPRDSHARWRGSSRSSERTA